MNKLFYLLLLSTFCSCIHTPKTEKNQSDRDNIINVHDKVKEIEIEDILIGGVSRLTLINDYLIISDPRSVDKLIHLFDKKTFKYLTSTAFMGQGPGEIANIGHIADDEVNRLFYVSDHGKQRIFSYHLDSVLAHSFYMPEEKMKMNERKFLSKYQYINDTLSIGLIIEPTGNSGFNQSLAKWNMNTGEIKPMPYLHPEIEKKRICFAASMSQKIYVECYLYHDLMTICSLDGELKYNIYGPNWANQESKNSYYNGVAICNGRIIASYSGEETFVKNKMRGIKSNHPTKLLVFDLNGEYIQTLETGYQIADFCYDKDNNRIIMSLDDDIQFAYLDLNGLIK